MSMQSTTSQTVGPFFSIGFSWLTTDNLAAPGVSGERLTIEAADPVIIQAGRAALGALGDQASPPGTIRGDLPASASLSTVWQALHDSLQAIQRQAAPPADAPGAPDSPGEPGRPGTEAA